MFNHRSWTTSRRNRTPSMAKHGKSDANMRWPARHDATMVHGGGAASAGRSGQRIWKCSTSPTAFRGGRGGARSPRPDALSVDALASARATSTSATRHVGRLRVGKGNLRVVLLVGAPCVRACAVNRLRRACPCPRSSAASVNRGYSQPYDIRDDLIASTRTPDPVHPRGRRRTPSSVEITDLPALSWRNMSMRLPAAADRPIYKSLIV
jgi:hypothetical protein